MNDDEDNNKKTDKKSSYKNPWGPPEDSGKEGHHSKRNTSKNPPQDIDDVIDLVQQRFKKMMGDSNSFQKGFGSGQGRTPPGESDGKFGGGFFGHGPKSFSLVFIALIVLVVLWLSSGFFGVKEGEVGVVMRFGEMVRVAGPGLRYHLPAPFEEAIVKKVSAISRIDGGIIGDSKSPEGEQALTLTSDENMVIISYSMQWRIKDVAEYLFIARDPEGLVKVASESAVREVVGQTPARRALTEGREEISTKARELLQKILDTYKIGIEIVSFQLQRVEAPPQVIESFNDVQASLVDARRLEQEAETYRNKIVPVARGSAEKIRQESQAYAQKIVAEAEGDADRFNKVYEAYAVNKKVAMTRYHLETTQKVLKAAPSKILIDPDASKGMVPYLPLNDLKKNNVSVPAKEHESTHNLNIKEIQ